MASHFPRRLFITKACSRHFLRAPQPSSGRLMALLAAAARCAGDLQALPGWERRPRLKECHCCGIAGVRLCLPPRESAGNCCMRAVWSGLVLSPLVAEPNYCLLYGPLHAQPHIEKFAGGCQAAVQQAPGRAWLRKNQRARGTTPDIPPP